MKGLATFGSLAHTYVALGARGCATRSQRNTKKRELGKFPQGMEKIYTDNPLTKVSKCETMRFPTRLADK